MRSKIWIFASGIVIVLAIIFFIMQRDIDHTRQEVEIYHTAQGKEFWLLEDHYLPIVTLQFSVPFSGAAYDPEEKLGLANMVASLLDEGAGEYDSQQFQTELEAIASSISFSVDNDYFYVSVKTLKAHLPRALELLSLALTQPVFSDDVLTRVRNQLIVSISKQKEKPAYLVSEKLQEIFYEGHPYRHPIEGNVETLRAITHDDLVSFVSQHFIRERMNVSVVGAVSSDEIAGYLDALLTKLPSGSDTKQEQSLPALTRKLEKTEVHVPINVPQTVIAYAVDAPLRSSKDFYPTYVLNYILGGGGFESRLMKEIREERGLVYSVYSSYGTQDYAGFISGSAATESEKSPLTIAAIKKEFERINQEGVTQQELDDAKSYLIHSFPLRMTRNSYLVSFLDTMQREKLGVDFLEQRNAMVEAVTLEQVNNVAREWFDPERLVVVSAGQELQPKQE